MANRHHSFDSDGLDLQAVQISGAPHKNSASFTSIGIQNRWVPRIFPLLDILVEKEDKLSMQICSRCARADPLDIVLIYAIMAKHHYKICNGRLW